MPKSNAGRPTKMTPETIKKLEDGFMMDFTVTEACLYVGVSTQAFYEYNKKNP
jgi:hypothetical protein